MIWIVCRGCGAESLIDTTDGNDPSCESAIDAGMKAFLPDHIKCGHVELRDSYGRTYGMTAPTTEKAGAPS